MKLSLLFILLLCSWSSTNLTAGDVIESLDNDLELNLDSFKAKQGCDIWLSIDQGKTWSLVGKTFTAGGQYVYQSEYSGLHFFFVHSRKNKEDNFRPKPDAKPHFKILIKTLEENNAAILYTNKRSMLINYDIDDATVALPDGSFESWLYITLDSGLNWSLYGADDDGKSPILFVAANDGLFGFRVISSDIAGQKESAPEPGSAPDILVRIDTKGPEVELISPQPYDLWVEKSTRKIRWNCKDESMDRLKSVSVYYSVGAPVDWILIADNLPSSGAIPWKVPASQNGRLFIQVRAVDKSGNQGLGQTEQPFFNRNVLEELLSDEVKEQANSYYETATICRKNREYPKAIKYFRLCLQLNPYHIRAHNDIGITLLKMNLKEESFAHFETHKFVYSYSNLYILNAGNLL